MRRPGRLPREPDSTPASGRCGLRGGTLRCREKPRKSMSRMNTRMLVAATLGLVAIGWLGACRMTVKEMEDLIKKEVPIGSSTVRVLAFLDSKKIEHSRYLEDRKAIYAIIRDTGGDFLVKKSLTLAFFFDDDGNLIKYTVEEVFTGP